MVETAGKKKRLADSREREKKNECLLNYQSLLRSAQQDVEAERDPHNAGRLSEGGKKIKKSPPPLCLTASQYGCHPRLFHSGPTRQFLPGRSLGEKKKEKRKSNFKAARVRLVCHIGHSEYLPCCRTPV